MCTKLPEECYETSSSRGLNFRRGEGACKSLRASDPNIFGATLEHLSTGTIKGSRILSSPQTKPKSGFFLRHLSRYCKLILYYLAYSLIFERLYNMSIFIYAFELSGAERPMSRPAHFVTL